MLFARSDSQGRACFSCAQIPSKGGVHIELDTNLLLDDFVSEARAHIEKIETAFLDINALSNNNKAINSVFRAAHSIKGTAGFFTLDKIVAVAHELESIFSLIKNNKLPIDEKIADIALQSVDCLKDLVDHIRDDGAIDVSKLVKSLKGYSNIESSEYNVEDEIFISFDFNDNEMLKIFKDAIRHGHKIYYINVNFNRGLGRFYTNPRGMIDNILSIGNIVGAVINGNQEKIAKDTDIAVISQKLAGYLAENESSALELLITSVLDFDLFSIAVEINKKHIRHLSKEAVLGTEGAVKTKKAKPASNDGEKDGEKTEQAQTEAENNILYTKISKTDSDFLIHLKISVINELLDLANEMILTRNQLLSSVTEHNITHTGLTPVLHNMNRLTSEIQEKVMLTRMQPISVIFDKFPRIIRDTAKTLKKEIEIEIHGGDVTLDKYLLDSLADPITQLVKNAADHGLEPAERRTALGKEKKGKITLNAYMRDGSAFIEVTDDGGGINTERLKQKALEAGIATEESLLEMPRGEMLSLILEPGFSTAKHVTNLSGRGVGMDIVKTNIEKLGGSIEIESENDKGTTIRLKMPLTLSVMGSLIVEINSVQFAVPEINVERIVRIWGAMPARRIERMNNSLVLSLNGYITPIVTMDEIHAKAKGHKPPSIDMLMDKIRSRDVNKCLIFKVNNKNFALLIDDAIGTEQTLVKPLPEYLKNCLCYSNVTVLGNGNAITILDAEGILRLMGIEGVEKNILADDSEKDKKQVIVFMCSGVEYFALEMSEISRIETISPEQIQDIGNKHYINIADETIELIRPENYAPVKKRRYNSKKLYVLTLKKGVSPIGLLVSKVLDKIEDTFKIDHDRIYNDFIIGTSTFKEKILIFLNPETISSNVEKSKYSKGRKKEAQYEGLELL